MGKALLQCLFASPPEASDEATTRPLSWRLQVWNRSFETTRELVESARAQYPNVAVSAHTELEGALLAATQAGQIPIICTMLPNYAVTEELLLGATSATARLLQDHELLRQASLICLNSGSPDQARAFAARVMAQRAAAAYLDGCVIGSPHAVRGGRATLLYSCAEPPPPAIVSLLAHLSRKVICCGTGYGAAKALDYALVDHFFLNTVSLFHAINLCQREGISDDLALSALSGHAATFPAAWTRMLAKIATGCFGNDSASLQVWREFFSHRTEYLRTSHLSPRIPDWACALIDAAVEGAPLQASLSDDLVRLHDLFHLAGDRDVGRSPSDSSA